MLRAYCLNIYAPIRCNSDAKHVKHSRACTVLPTEWPSHYLIDTIQYLNFRLGIKTKLKIQTNDQNWIWFYSLFLNLTKITIISSCFQNQLNLSENDFYSKNIELGETFQFMPLSFEALLLLKLCKRYERIFNIINWVAGSMEQRTRWPSVRCS